VTSEQIAGRGCRFCRAEIPSGAGFCPNCGSATRRGRQQVRQSLVQEGMPARRAAMALGMIFVGGVAALILSSEIGDPYGLLDVLFFAVVSVPVLALLSWPSPSHLLGARLSCWGSLLAALAGVVCFAVAWAYVALLSSFSPSSSAPDFLDPSPWWTVVLLVPCLEEWMFRGLAWQAVRRIGSVRLTILVTSMMFALMHGLNGGFWLEFPHRVLGGLLLGVVRWKTGSIYPAIVTHAVWNALAVTMAD